jgi:hypothetical protein
MTLHILVTKKIASVQRITFAPTAGFIAILRMQAASFSTTLTNFHQSTQHHISRLVLTLSDQAWY